MTEAKTDFARWCEAHDEGPDGVDADLEGYPLPHEWETDRLIRKAAKLHYDKAWCGTMLRLERKGKARKSVIVALEAALEM